MNGAASVVAFVFAWDLNFRCSTAPLSAVIFMLTTVRHIRWHRAHITKGTGQPYLDNAGQLQLRLECKSRIERAAVVGEGEECSSMPSTLRCKPSVYEPLSHSAFWNSRTLMGVPCPSRKGRPRPTHHQCFLSGAKPPPFLTSCMLYRRAQFRYDVAGHAYTWHDEHCGKGYMYDCVGRIDSTYENHPQKHHFSGHDVSAKPIGPSPSPSPPGQCDNSVTSPLSSTFFFAVNTLEED